ncbi:uncharacterized protein LOC143850422 [Tasmannia lanceolata]|uniref:uncharacterized protein LOC143850422 n=1 Tax=Tasmannia lanceolata TaxID=3420 RepID=UPI00406455E5
MMLLHGASDGFLCRAFLTTLTGAARDWYSRIKLNYVSNFDDFGDDLVRHFMSSRRPRKTTASLMALRQENNEPLKTFVRRFNREALQVPKLDPSAAMSALLAGARSNDFRRSVARQNPHSLADLMTGAEEYIAVEETLTALDSNRRRTSGEGKNPTKQRRDDKAPKREKSPQRREENFTPLNTSRRHILAAIKEEEFVRWPTRMLSKGNKRDQSKYCRFHKDHGHDTDECWQLKEEIELLIGRGYLNKYVRGDGRRPERRERSPRGRSPRGRSPRRSQPPPVRNPSPLPPSSRLEAQRSQPRGVIGTIMGRPAARGTSSAACKAYARRANAVHTCSKKMKTENEISFSDADLDNLILPHDDALVLTMLVANWEVKKILVDNGISADILYYHAFEKMMIGDDRLKPANSDLFGFSGEVVKVEGQIKLPVLVGESPCQAFAMVNFLDDNGKVVQIESSLSSSIQQHLTKFLQDNADVFAWAPIDMPGIDPEITTHRLGVDSTCKPVKQKRRHFAPERRQAIKEEVEKLLKADFIREIQYPDWLANVVLIGRNMEVYVDDMLVKSRSAQDHVSDLKETFEVLRQRSMKLNPTKCTFGVSSGKFLGFMSESGEELLLYLSVSPTALAAVLVREEHSQQKPIYYVSKVLHDAEIRYQRIEKLAYALVVAARKLRPYFQAHTIKVLTDQPLRQILHRPDTSGRLVKWAVELSEFDIRFGIPRVLITDNGKQFDCKNFRKFCSDLKIEQRFTSVAHPQTNGQTEVTNRILLQGIKKRLDDKAGRWADELYHVLWAYRTTPRTSTGESPFNLSFGTEAVIPVDVGTLSPRVTNFNEQLNGDGLHANLDLLEEAREESRIRVAAYKQKVSNYHDCKIRRREFRT